MREATPIVAMLLGLTAGISGMGRGYFEILQGNTQPEGMVIASIGPPCDPETMYSACGPAMTLIPDFLITGILAVCFGLLLILATLLLSVASANAYDRMPGAAPILPWSQIQVFAIPSGDPEHDDDDHEAHQAGE